MMRLLRARKSPPRLHRLPDGVRIYAVGDIHGRIDLLDSMLARIDADLARSPCSDPIEVFLGDYIDRGPASCAVIDRLIERRRSRRAICLRGNHETYLSAFLEAPETLRQWRRFGGIETLMSYGLRPGMSSSPDEEQRLAERLREAVCERHRMFLADLPTSFGCGDYFFAHAGVRPRIPLADQSEQDLLGIRGDFLDCGDDFGKLVVHGHTPVITPDFRANRINIDTGAYITGRLTCLRIEGQQHVLL